MKPQNFETLSYKSHENWYRNLPDPLVRIKNKTSVDYWRHERMYKLLIPLLDSRDKWLTVGDGVGTDANWLIGKGMDVTATDIADSVLRQCKTKGYIQEYQKENAEKLSFPDESFNYVLCKESFHHFPRPYLALYEMIRVASNAVILIEPIDVGIQMPGMVFLKNVLDVINKNLIYKVWPNRFSYEEVGNFVYKISEREIEKVAAGINLPAIAFKGINDYHSTSLNLSAHVTNRKIFRKVWLRIFIRNILSKLGIIPYMLLTCIIFKSNPAEEVILNLHRSGYNFTHLPCNPYLKNLKNENNYRRNNLHAYISMSYCNDVLH